LQFRGSVKSELSTVGRLPLGQQAPVRRPPLNAVVRHEHVDRIPGAPLRHVAPGAILALKLTVRRMTFQTRDTPCVGFRTAAMRVMAGRARQPSFVFQITSGP
jgi:hypothetical protein